MIMMEQDTLRGKMVGVSECSEEAVAAYEVLCDVRNHMRCSSRSRSGSGKKVEWEPYDTRNERRYYERGWALDDEHDNMMLMMGMDSMM